MAAECDLAWTLLGQAPQGARDAELLRWSIGCEGETAIQLPWLRARMESGPAPALVVAMSAHRWRRRGSSFTARETLRLGFLALAGGTLLVSGLQLTGSRPDGLRRARAGAFVVPLQLFSSVLGFFTRDVVAGTGMGMLAGTWLSIGLVTLTSRRGRTSDALGLFLRSPASAMLRPSRPRPAASSCSCRPDHDRPALPSAHRDLSTHRKRHVGRRGGLYPASCFCGLEHLRRPGDGTRGRPRRQTLLPVLRMGGRAFGAPEGGLEGQLARVEHEAGVREQL